MARGRPRGHTDGSRQEFIVNRTFVSDRAWLFAALLVLAHSGAAAQTKSKSPPRLQPPPSQTSQLPAGVDSGSPASSDTMQLGTPVPPGPGAERSELKANSAAARAAARPKPAASSADCNRKTTDVAAMAAKPASATGPRAVPVGTGASGAAQTAARPPGC
jgi:hypothetical protein